ncbi:MAG: OB-fold domain-containing protein, partial [Gemmiger qucibialis]|nr:OB-fold domain-containing protein [Gemmiger qucibialis]
MIYSLTGKILKKTLDTVVISCAGVGYAVQVP